MSLLHVITDFVSFATAFLLKNPSLTHAVVPPFRNRSRSSRLFGCKRPHDGSLSLPTFADSRTGASPVPTVVRNYRLTFLRLAKDCKGLNPINNLQKNNGTVFTTLYRYFWQRTLTLIETILRRCNSRSEGVHFSFKGGCSSRFEGVQFSI